MDQMSLFRRIVIAKYQTPNHVDDDAKDLINKLLVRRQAARIGNLSRGHRDIQDHPWFKDITWTSLLRKKIAAPWVPEIKDPFDASHFDDYSSEHNNSRHSSKLGNDQQTHPSEK